jgi:hypothetical protein
MKNIKNNKWFWMAVIILFILSGIQFMRPAFNNPPVTADIAVAVDVKNILRNACYDCHSNETKLAWFDKITPVNWLVASHINGGRKVLNFSEWNSYTKDRQKQILFESFNQIQFGIMPLKQYTLLHPAAKIGAAENNLLKSYLSTLMVTQEPDTAKINKWNAQYTKWFNGEITLSEIKPAPNGIAFQPEYKDWTAISSTERIDNGTMRIIVGNDVAITAIKTKHTNPWPDGTTFAKLIWSQVADSSSDIYAGEFKQVDFMTKNKDKYWQTDGWGYSRWLMGTQLVPYGENALFTTGCVNCHQSMKKQDYVFTIPVNITADTGFEDKVLSSSINKKDSTMSTLYGNDIATLFVRTQTGNDYPAGTILTFVTWKQKEDQHWFGGIIPSDIKLIEKIRFINTGKEQPEPVYQKYEGNSLVKTATDKLNDRERINFIVNLRASVIP